MHCPVCNAELTQSTRICPVCGNIFADTVQTQFIPDTQATQKSQYAAPTPPVFVPTAPVPYQNVTGYKPYTTKPQKSASRFTVITLVSAAVILIFLGAIIFLTGKNPSPEKVAEKYYRGLQDLDLKTMDECMAVDAETYIRLLITSTGSDPDALCSQYDASDCMELFSKLSIARITQLSNTYGKNYSVSITALGSRTLESAEASSVLNKLNDDLAELGLSADALFHTNDITDIKLVNLSCEISGSLKTTNDQASIYCAKIHGKWKVILEGEESFEL